MCMYNKGTDDGAEDWLHLNIFIRIKKYVHIRTHVNISI
jgi:hypothetical protein